MIARIQNIIADNLPDHWIFRAALTLHHYFVMLLQFKHK
jgi:hypothetical protein